MHDNENATPHAVDLRKPEHLRKAFMHSLLVGLSQKQTLFTCLDRLIRYENTTIAASFQA